MPRMRVHFTSSHMGALLFLGVTPWLGFEYLCSAPRVGSALRLTLPEGTTFAAIGGTLAGAGVIRSPAIFEWMARSRGARPDSSVKPGEYVFRPNENVRTVVNRLVTGDTLTYRVVVEPPATIRSAAAAIAAQGLASEVEFTAAASRPPRSFRIPTEATHRNLEGYLPAGEYIFRKPISPTAMVQAMVDVWFADVFSPRRSELTNGRRSLDELVIIASIVEAAADDPRDRPYVASVIENRLEREVPLETPDVVLSLLRGMPMGDPRSRGALWLGMKHIGLPQAPVLTPNGTSLDAVLHPASTEYLSFQKRGTRLWFSKKVQRETLPLIREAEFEWERPAHSGRRVTAEPE